MPNRPLPLENRHIAALRDAVQMAVQWGGPSDKNDLAAQEQFRKRIDEMVDSLRAVRQVQIQLKALTGGGQ